MTREKFYIKGEENNAKKKINDVREGTIDNLITRKNHYTSYIRDKGMFK